MSLVLGSPDVVLRGPWDGTNVVKVAPTAADIGRGLEGYHLDFPGRALSPGCAYDEWAERINLGRPATTYARVVADPAYPGQLALQYWFFYVFNDFNDKHEGDWEMIQLDFAAPTARAALHVSPSFVGYSQHEAAERARWGDRKLELAGGTHPVVYSALGSHANYFGAALYLGRSAAQGVGCDETSGRTTQVRPHVAFVPTDAASYLRVYPWLGYDGRWGEAHLGFYDGPTGPNTKQQWTQPITWANEHWRGRSYTVPGGTAVGHTATGFFCGAVAAGSGVLVLFARHPSPLFFVLAGILVFALWLASRTRWTPPAPLRLPRRRAWGAILNASRRMYLDHARTFLGIGLLFLPLGILISIGQYVLFHSSSLNALVAVAGETNGFVDSVAISFGILVTIFGLAVVQSATATAMVELDRGNKPSALDAYRRVFRRLPSLLAVVVIPALLVFVLDLTAFGVVVAAWLVVRWSLAAQVVMLEDVGVYSGLRGSARLVRGSWFRTGSLLLFVTALALLLGPLVGTLLLFVSSASFDVINFVSAVVYAIVLPFVAIATTYLYFDLRVRRAIEESTPTDDLLPAEAT